MKTITKEEIKKFIDNKENISIINISSFDKFTKTHIPTSHNIPLKSDNFKELILDTIENKNKKIIIYSNEKSKNPKIAINKLEKLGYKNVFEYNEEIKEWNKRFN